MYHHLYRPDVIEGSDITRLHDIVVQQLGDRIFATLQVELRNDKDYQESGHVLHVTDGVNPRILEQEHDIPAVETQERDTASSETQAGGGGENVEEDGSPTDGSLKAVKKGK